MDFEVEATKRLYPKGTRVELERMQGEDVPPGTKGTVTLVDDLGTLHVIWDNGSTLGLIPGEDTWKKI